VRRIVWFSRVLPAKVRLGSLSVAMNQAESVGVVHAENVGGGLIGQSTTGIPSSDVSMNQIWEPIGPMTEEKDGTVGTAPQFTEGERMTRHLGPMPLAPRKFIRDFDKHGHHRSCECSDSSEQIINPPCTCAILDDDDYHCECERRYDSWKDGDYAIREEMTDDY
jgi:hypothetical protein